MIRGSALVLATAILAALAPIGPWYGSRARAAAAPVAPPARVLYQADWSTGSNGWTLYPGFRAAHGMLSFDGKTDSGAFAPFTVTGLANFAVEATIKVGASATPARAFYDIFARRASTQSSTGIFAGYAANGGEKAATHVASLYWFGPLPFSINAPGASFQPDAGFHTYRLETHGNVYRLLIDGRAMVPWTLVKLQTAGNMVGLTFTYVPAAVKSFTVYALPPVPVTTSLDTSALQGHVLAPSDVPFTPDNAVFRDNTRYALDTKLDLATVRRTGRLYGYYQGFQGAATYVEQSVNLHQNPAGAHAAFALFSGNIQKSTGQYLGYRVESVTGEKIGDESFAFGYHYLLQGSPSYVLKVLFHRGNYYVVITVDTADQRVLQTAVAYARRADALVQDTGTAGNGYCVAC
jgi:hypothetical protein